jgi:hypothetical protein
LPFLLVLQQTDVVIVENTFLNNHKQQLYTLIPVFFSYGPAW